MVNSDELHLRPEPEHIEAILQWCNLRRPDLVPRINEMIGGGNKLNEATRLLLGIGFEAGRCFQYVNPKLPLGPILPQSIVEPIEKTGE